MRTMQTPLAGIGLVLILVGGLRGEGMTDGAAALIALLILAVATYPPADPRRGDQAAMILASAAGLLALGLLFEEVGADMGMEKMVDDFSVLGGSALVTVDAMARALRHREDYTAAGWGGDAEGAEPVSPFSRG